MREYAVSFFGHRRIDNASAVEKQLEAIVCDLLTCQGYVTFFVGRDGDFDLLAASVIHRCQRQIRSDNSALVWVMPYVTADYRANETAYQSYYNENYLPDMRKASKKVLTNYQPKGGTQLAFDFAKAQGKVIINLYTKGA